MTWHGKVHLAVVEQMVEEAELELADHIMLADVVEGLFATFGRRARATMTINCCLFVKEPWSFQKVLTMILYLNKY
jgi:hypothetical protein